MNELREIPALIFCETNRQPKLKIALTLKSEADLLLVAWVLGLVAWGLGPGAWVLGPGACCLGPAPAKSLYAITNITVNDKRMVMLMEPKKCPRVWQRLAACYESTDFHRE